MLKNYIWKTLNFVFTATICLILIRSLLIEPGKINGISMEPTFLDENIFLVEKFSLLFSSPKRGQIVQIYLPSLNEIMVKRIIGLPGEQITIKQNGVFITDVDQQTWKLPEVYLADGVATKSRLLTTETYPKLKRAEYFVLGDNRRESTDSRNYGPVHRSQIFGQAIQLPFLK
ncbi:MAG TPA: signal peptidase I [Patescibacteria group bacterium]|nr:signal peptidase I [Patescibacteria group bacterium]